MILSPLIEEDTKAQRGQATWPKVTQLVNWKLKPFLVGCQTLVPFYCIVFVVKKGLERYQERKLFRAEYSV